jgi:TonB family protein
MLPGHRSSPFGIPAAAIILTILATMNLHAQKPHLAQAQEGVEALAIPVAKMIRDSGKSSLVVMPLADPQGRIDALGANLARSVSESLAKAVPGIRIINPATLRFPGESELGHIPSASTTEILQGLAKDAGADVCVLGDYSRFKDQVGISLHAWNPDRSLLAESFGGIPLTQEIEAAASKPLLYTSPADGIYSAGLGGIGKPECINCSSLQTSSSSMGMVGAGFVSMDLVVSADGTLTRATVLESSSPSLSSRIQKELHKVHFSPALAPDGSPVNARVHFQYSLIRLEIKILADGRVGEARVVESPDAHLSDLALQTVKTWKFKPATGPGGKTSPYATIVEISFMLVG